MTTSAVVLSALFGTLLFGEPFNAILLLGIALTIGGVYLISKQPGPGPNDSQNDSGPYFSWVIWQGILIGLLTGACWAISPVFFRWGYEETPSVFVAVLISLVAGWIVSVGVWMVMCNRDGRQKQANDVPALKPVAFWTWQLLAGIVVGASIFGRWVALIDLPIVVVNSINMMVAPMVVFLSPRLLGRALESSGWRLWVGTISILVGVGLTLLGGL